MLMIDLIDVFVHLDALGRFVATTVAGPIVLWTLVALAAWGGLRLVPGHPLVQYWTRVGVLLALPLGLCAALLDLQLGALALPATTETLGLDLLLDPVVVEASASSAPAWQGVFVGLGLGMVCAGGAALIAGARLVADGFAVTRFCRAYPPNAPTWVQDQADTQATALGITRPVSVCCAPDIAVPMTVGGWRPRLFLPESLCSDEQALAMTLTHELVHVRRFDYVIHVLVRTVRALFVVHPLVHIYARAVATYREQACDAAVLAHNQVPRNVYAKLLLQWTQRATARSATQPASALGLAYSSSTLKSRINAMTSHSPTSRPALSLVLSALLLTSTFALMACGDVGTNEATGPESSPLDSPTPAASSSDSVYIAVEDNPELNGGMQALYSAISYPEIAREHGVEGRVVVRFVVDTDGTPTDLTVLTVDVESGNPEAPEAVSQALEEAALNAVRQVTFTPGKQNGVPLRVQMALPIMFQLSE